MSRLPKMIGILGFVAVLGTGIENASGQCPTPPAGYDCKCNVAETRWVCADWAQPGTPNAGVDFFVTYTGDIPEVKFATADDGWVLYSEVISSGAAAALGDVLLASDVSPDGEDFKVSIYKVFAFAAGATSVSSIVLDSTDVNWTGGSLLHYGVISGDVGAIEVIAGSGADDGELSGNFTVHGNVTGPITIPKLTGNLTIHGDVNEGFVIDVLDGVLDINGTLPALKTGEIGDIVSSKFDIDTVAAGATLDLLNGLPLAAQQCNVSTLAGTLDLHTKDVRSPLFLGDVLGTGKVLNGGILAEVFYPAFNGEFADGATATFSSVAAGGEIYAFDSDATRDTNISGDITINGDYAGLFKVDGDFTSTASLTITGDLKTSSGTDGLIWIVEAAAGDVLIKGDLIGHVHHPKSFATNGSLTVEGNVTSSGVFKTGDNATGETHDGDLIFQGNVVGDILIHGNMSGDITITDNQTGDLTIDEDLSGSITIGGSLANAGLGGGRIMIAGESSGPIKVGKKTGSLTLIQVAGGLAVGATIEINTTEGRFNAIGDMHIGGTTPAALPFDGCIRIYDQLSSGNLGHLKGDLDIVMCHADGDQLVVCIDGSDNGNVTLDQTGCPYQTATWDCYAPGCP